MPAPGRPRSGSTYPMATAFTNRPMPAAPGAIWDSASRGSSAASASIPTTRISSMSRHSATSSVPTRNAGCSDRAMAARAGAMFFIETPIRALSIWRWIRAIRASYLRPSGRPAGTSGTSRAEGREAGSSVPPTVARAGRRFRDIRVCQPVRSASSALRCRPPSRDGSGEIWASTDDGLVHVTRDDGNSWQNVTPSGMPELAYVGCVEISSHDADTIYVAATRYKLADYKPYLFRTTDGGRTFESINGDFPGDEITRVVRADPARKGLLFAGTETGFYCSLNDGQSWVRMGGGLPVAPVYDLKIKGTDLVAGTHGRSFWILDDITPLRGLVDGSHGSRLFEPRMTVRTKLHFGGLRRLMPSGGALALAPGVGGGIRTFRKPDGTSDREFLDVGENPPNGAIVHYWLDEGVSDPVSLAFYDDSGAAIASFRSDDSSLPAAKRPSGRSGLHP